MVKGAVDIGGVIVPADRVIAIEKGKWHNGSQHWDAVLVFDSKLKIEVPVSREHAASILWPLPPEPPKPSDDEEGLRPMVVAGRTLEAFARVSETAGHVEAADLARQYGARAAAGIEPCPWTIGWKK